MWLGHTHLPHPCDIHTPLHRGCLMTPVPQRETTNVTHRVVLPKSMENHPKRHCPPSPNLHRLGWRRGGIWGQGYRLFKINMPISISGPPPGCLVPPESSGLFLSGESQEMCELYPSEQRPLLLFQPRAAEFPPGSLKPLEV